jgi:hypothetical protein
MEAIKHQSNPEGDEPGQAKNAEQSVSPHAWEKQ